jgi:hypothetical protein
MATTMLQEIKTEQQKKLFTDLFFTNDKDFLFVGIGTSGKNGELDIKRSIYNDRFFKDNSIDYKLPLMVNRENSDKYKRSFNDEAVVHNVSARFGSPVVAVTFPSKRSK